MTAKVTGKVVIIFIMLTCCQESNEYKDDLLFQQKLDSMASASIDSAYEISLKDCEEKTKLRLPILIDSLLRTDTSLRD